METLESKIVQKNIELHEKEAELYDLIHPQVTNFYYTRKVNRDVDFIMKNLKNKPSVLELGPGTGHLTLKLLKYDVDITGVDISKDMLNVLRGKIPENKNIK